jgi:hypothetical protein
MHLQRTLYVYLQRTLLAQSILSPFDQFVFKNIWRSVVPSKVSALMWQLLLDRIPTRVNLCKRGIITLDTTLCPLCGRDPETARHLFLHCPFAAAVWYALNRWLGVMVVLPGEVLASYGQFMGSGRNKRSKWGSRVCVWLLFG